MSTDCDFDRYQANYPFQGLVDVKVKGSGFVGDVTTCGGGTGTDWPTCGPYDTGDNIIPPEQEGAVFIGTSFFATTGQKRGLCASRNPCKSDADCHVGSDGNVGHPSYLNGKCADGESMDWRCRRRRRQYTNYNRHSN